MSKFKFYTTMVICLCTVAIGSSVEFYGSLNTTATTIEEAHTNIFNSSKEGQNQELYNSLKALVYNN